MARPPSARCPSRPGSSRPSRPTSWNAGTHSIIAEFVGAAPYSSSASAPITATYTLVGAVDEQTVTVEIPAGTINITTPYTPAAPLARALPRSTRPTRRSPRRPRSRTSFITDTRSGNLGFTASVVSGPFVGATGSFPGIHAGLTNLVPVQVAGNALQASNVVVRPHAVLRRPGRPEGLRDLRGRPDRWHGGHGRRLRRRPGPDLGCTRPVHRDGDLHRRLTTVTPASAGR